jgi:predicted GNAT family acetyltransferase
MHHNEAAHRFESEVTGHMAHLDYRMSKDRILFTHTEVPEELAGQGVGGALARAGLDYARQAHLRVVSHCAFVTTYIERHPEYQDLLGATESSDPSI